LLFQTIDGAEALNYLRQSADLPGLILLDIAMPKMTGWEFLGHQQHNGIDQPGPTKRRAQRYIQQHADREGPGDLAADAAALELGMRTKNREQLLGSGFLVLGSRFLNIGYRYKLCQLGLIHFAEALAGAEQARLDRAVGYAHRRRNLLGAAALA